MPDVQVVSPRAHEASDGRIVLIAPRGTERVGLRISGEMASAKVLARRDVGGRVRFELQVPTVARAGADLNVTAIGGGATSLGRATVTDVHLLGSDAFGSAAAVSPSAAGSRRARQIAANHGGITGVSVSCRSSGRVAGAHAGTQTRAASTFKVPIVLAAMALDNTETVGGSGGFDVYRRAIANSDNDAANAAITRAGGGDQVAGTAAVNRLFSRLGMNNSVLDGPFIATSGRSRKLTTAKDLATLGSALLDAARDGSGPLAEAGVSQHEARVLVGLMSATTHSGLVREHVPGPVANKAGWLDDQQNDLALLFGVSGGPCAMGVVTEGLTFSSADAFGRQSAKQIIPLLASPRAPSSDADDAAQESVAVPADTRTDAGTPPTTTQTASVPAAPKKLQSPDQQDDGGATPDRGSAQAAGPTPTQGSWSWGLIAGVGAPLIAIIGLISWRSRVIRRRERLREARRAARLRS